MLILAEALGAVALVVNFIGYRQNTINRYRLISAFALAFVGAHFFMLSAMAAGVACWLASIRNIIAIYTQHVSIVVIFVLINLGFFAYEWWWLDHHWLIIFAYASSIIFTVGSVMLRSAAAVRKWFILAEGLGLVYVLASGSIFGTLFTVSNMVSIIIKLREDRRKEAGSKA